MNSPAGDPPCDFPLGFPFIKFHRGGTSGEPPAARSASKSRGAGRSAGPHMRSEISRKPSLANDIRLESIYSFAVLHMRVSSLPNSGHPPHVDVYSRRISGHSAGTQIWRRPDSSRSHYRDMRISVAACVLIHGEFARIPPRYTAFRTHLSRIGIVSPAVENAAVCRDFSKPPWRH